MLKRRRDVERVLKLLKERKSLPLNELSDTEKVLLEELKCMGYRIGKRKGSVSLVSAPDIPYPWEVALYMSGRYSRIFRNIIFFHTLDSTSNYLLKNADAYRSWTAVIADHQTGGRGRKGAKWHSPPGCNIYTSILIKPEKLPHSSIAPLTLVAGISVIKTLEELGLQTGGLKWPNDVFASGRKLAGILTEARVSGDQISIVLGVGVNVNMRFSDFPVELQERATSFYMETGRKIPRARVIALLYENLYLLGEEFFKGGFSPFVNEYTKRCILNGKVVEIKEDGRVLKGRVKGIDVDGGLLLELSEGGTGKVISGEVVRVHDTNN